MGSQCSLPCALTTDRHLQPCTLSVMPMCRHQNGSSEHDMTLGLAVPSPGLFYSLSAETYTFVSLYQQRHHFRDLLSSKGLASGSELWESAGEVAVAFLLTTTISPVA